MLVLKHIDVVRVEKNAVVGWVVAHGIWPANLVLHFFKHVVGKQLNPVVLPPVVLRCDPPNAF